MCTVICARTRHLVTLEASLFTKEDQKFLKKKKRNARASVSFGNQSTSPFLSHVRKKGKGSC